MPKGPPLGLSELKKKLAELEACENTSDTATPVPLVDHSAAYSKQADGYQYETKFERYEYDTDSYGVVPPPDRPPEAPADSATLLVGSISDLVRENDALQRRMLPAAEADALRRRWVTLQQDVSQAEAVLRELLQRCNVAPGAVPSFDVATPDAAKMEVFSDPPVAWKTAAEGGAAFAERATKMSLFSTMQRLRYQWATEQATSRSVVMLTALHRRLEADAAEAHGALHVIRGATTLVQHCQNRAETSTLNEEFIVRLNRVSEAEEKRIRSPQAVTMRLAPPRRSTEEELAANARIRGDQSVVVPGDVEFKPKVEQLAARVNAALNPARAFFDLGQCQREWSLILAAAEGLLAEIDESDGRRGERRQRADERYDAVRYAMATHDISAIVAVGRGK